MKRFFLLLLLILLNSVAYPQGYSNTMVFGYGGGSFSPVNDEYGLNILTFSDGVLVLSDNQESELEFNDTDAAISDENGNLLFYFNGVSIYDHAHHVMDNGYTLNEFNQFGYDLPQGGIIIPYPEKPNNYLLFYSKEEYLTPWGGVNIAVYYAKIDMTKNNGLGKVVERDQLVVADTLEYGKLQIVQHANGRDWWFVIGEAFHNAFYCVLIDPVGVHNFNKQHTGTNREYGYGQAVFSADGSKYVAYGAFGANGDFEQSVDIYSFDRCTAQFSGHQSFKIMTGSSFNGGAIISPNAHWLYVASKDWLYKYDLSANQIEATREIIATYEPYNDPFPTKFHFGFLAPDDKIYITTTSGSRTLHVIHQPDEPGTACAFEQHGVRLHCYNGNSVPTFANYRLGPLDGSPCDTLGIDNIPISWWRYEQDTLQNALVAFRDLSYHEPMEWSWDFGDGITSTERHPVHEYATTGTYEVCLTVSNDHGSDTHCKTLYSTVAIKDNPGIVAAIKVAPSPFLDRLSVSLGVNLRSPLFQLYDQMGRPVLSAQLAYGITEMETHQLTPGMYFWEVLAGGERVKSGKVVKVGK